MLAGGMLVVALAVIGCWVKLRRQRLISRLQALRGKVVVITGASSGLGEACAHVFYVAGCKLVLCARTQEELEPVKSDLEKLQLTGHTYDVNIATFDLGDLPGIAIAMEKVLSYHGHVDIIINNGGVGYRGAIAETLVDIDVSVMNVNYFGSVAVTKALLPQMMTRKSGHIVAISSIQGKLAIPYRSAYGASKHALQSFFDALRAEMVQYGIHVTVISPAYIRTGLSMNAVTNDGSVYGKTDSTTASGMNASAVAERVLHAIALQEKEVLLAPLSYKLATYLRNAFPNILCYIMAKRAIRQSDMYRKQL